MMIIMRMESTREEVDAVIERVRENGFVPHPIIGEQRSVVAVVGDNPIVTREQYVHMPGVDRVMSISRPYKIASREVVPENSVVQVNGLRIGGDEIIIVAGPCSVESREQILESAHAVKEAGAHALRGGAYKPRTSPYSFQGLGEKGLEYLAEAKDATGLAIFTEVIDPETLPIVSQFADVLQIGARNMQSFSLLHAVGESKKPVLLKRGNSATIDELLMAGEYILSHGNHRVILCERGIRTFETATRNTADINAIPVLKKYTHLPVFLDPSHSTGHWEYVAALARAGVAAGADGLIIEVHPNPDAALSDGGQSLKPERFAELVKELRAVAEAVGRR